MAGLPRISRPDCSGCVTFADCRVPDFCNLISQINNLLSRCTIYLPAICSKFCIALSPCLFEQISDCLLQDADCRCKVFTLHPPTFHYSTLSKPSKNHHATGLLADTTTFLTGTKLSCLNPRERGLIIGRVGDDLDR